MPIYEYQCTACGHEFEEWQKISDKPVKKCPSCEAKKVERLVSVSSFHLKGGGWYRDGYGSSKSNAKSGESSKSSKSSTSDGDAGTSAKGIKAKEKGGSKSSSSTASA